MSPTPSPSAPQPAIRRPAGPGAAPASPAAPPRSPAFGPGAASATELVSDIGAPTGDQMSERLLRHDRRLALELVRLDHPVDQPVLDRVLGLEELVAFHVGMDLLGRLTSVLDVDLVEALAQGEDLFGVDLDVAGLAFETAARLGDEDAGVGERPPVSL